MMEDKKLVFKEETAEEGLRRFLEEIENQNRNNLTEDELLELLTFLLDGIQFYAFKSSVANSKNREEEEKEAKENLKKYLERTAILTNKLPEDVQEHIVEGVYLRLFRGTVTPVVWYQMLGVIPKIFESAKRKNQDDEEHEVMDNGQD